MRFTATFILTALVAVGSALPRNVQRHVLHERRAESAQWVKRDRVHQEVKLPMRIGMTQSNLDKGADWLHEVFVFPIDTTPMNCIA